MYVVTLATRMAGRHSDELPYKQLKKRTYNLCSKIYSKHVVMMDSTVFEEQRGLLSRTNIV